MTDPIARGEILRQWNRE